MRLPPEGFVEGFVNGGILSCRTGWPSDEHVDANATNLIKSVPTKKKRYRTAVRTIDSSLQPLACDVMKRRLALKTVGEQRGKVVPAEVDTGFVLLSAGGSVGSVNLGCHV